MGYRYELGPALGLLPVEAAPVGKLADVTPQFRHDPVASTLTYDIRPYDPATEAPPVEVRVYAIPEGSEVFGAPAPLIVAAGLSYSAVEVVPDPAGVRRAPVLLPTYPKGTRNVGQVVLVYVDPDVPDEPTPDPAPVEPAPDAPAPDA